MSNWMEEKRKKSKLPEDVQLASVSADLSECSFEDALFRSGYKIPNISLVVGPSNYSEAKRIASKFFMPNLHIHVCEDLLEYEWYIITPTGKFGSLGA